MTDDDADGVRCCVAAPPRLQHDADDQSISVSLCRCQGGNSTYLFYPL